MGAVAEARGGLPVAGIARNMGPARQSVQRIADELEDGGHPPLRRQPASPSGSGWCSFTERGAALFDAASASWLALADTLVAALGAGEVNARRGAAARRPRVPSAP